jgi:SAM-dependent methyltransferase
MLNRLKNRPRIFGVFSLSYVRRQERLLSEVFASEDALASFRGGGRLPAGYGKGFDERVVEFPWLLSCALEGEVLDAGSTLNHSHVLEAVQPEISALTIVTLAPEPRAFPERGVSYLFADLRSLPFADSVFDTAVSVSTLEHVGMDNSLYSTGAKERAADPDQELEKALDEIRRVTADSGRLLITVPYGVPEDLGWLRQFDAAGIERLVELSGAQDSELTIFRYDAGGWQHSTPEEAADASYHMIDRERPKAAADGAAAARAVACLDLRLPGPS